MSYQNAKYEVLSKDKSVFSGGYVDNVQSVDMSPNYSPYLRNARFDGQSIIIRPGHTLHASLTTGDVPKGIGRATGSDIVVRHNQDTNKDLVLIDEDGAITEINTSTDIVSDNRMLFTNINDIIYCMNGSDDFGKLDGTTYTTPSTGITNFAPAFSVEFNGSHWASGWSANANKVYKSVGDDYEDFSSAGSDTFTFSETITGLASHDDALYYFTENTISKTGANDIQETSGAVTYFTRALTTSEGAVNQAGIVVADKYVFFVTPSNKIVMITEGQGEKGRDDYQLSERRYRGISKIMDTLDSDQSDCFGYFVPKDNLVKRHFKKQGSAFNDICIVYDIIRDGFFIDTQKNFFGGVSTGERNYTLSMIESKVFRDEYGQDDEDSAIPFEYHTKEYYLSSSTFKKILRETRTLVDINQLASLDQLIYIDGGLYDTKTVDMDNIDATIGGVGTMQIGNSAIGVGSGDNSLEEYQEITILRTKGNLNIKGKKMQLVFKCSTLAGKVRLKDIVVKFETLSQLANNLTE